MSKKTKLSQFDDPLRRSFDKLDQEVKSWLLEEAKNLTHLHQVLSFNSSSLARVLRHALGRKTLVLQNANLCVAI
jgi:hypothetical protein